MNQVPYTNPRTGNVSTWNPALPLKAYQSFCLSFKKLKPAYPKVLVEMDPDSGKFQSIGEIIAKYQLPPGFNPENEERVRTWLAGQDFSVNLAKRMNDQAVRKRKREERTLKKMAFSAQGTRSITDFTLTTPQHNVISLSLSLHPSVIQADSYNYGNSLCSYFYTLCPQYRYGRTSRSDDSIIDLSANTQPKFMTAADGTAYQALPDVLPTPVSSTPLARIAHTRY